MLTCIIPGDEYDDYEIVDELQIEDLNFMNSSGVVDLQAGSSLNDEQLDGEEQYISHNREHTFSNLIHEYPDWCASASEVKDRNSELIQSPGAADRFGGSRIREEVDYASLSISQNRAHDLALRVCSLGHGNCTTDGGNDVSRLIVIGGGARARISHGTNRNFPSLKR